MKKAAPAVIVLGALAVLALLSACATQQAVSADGLTAVEIFQRAQDAADRSEYALGISWYSLVPQTFPDDKEHVIWASYEIAFLYHKMGKNDLALSLINDVLAQYTKEGGNALPAAPRILGEKLKARLEPPAAPSTTQES